LQEFEEDAFCYIIPPFNSGKSNLVIELDYGDGDDRNKESVGLGSMFGYVGAFHHRYRNHTATVKESLDGSYLYTINLKKLKRLKEMNVSASNELFTPKELGFIRDIREIYPGIAQLQFNTSLASVTEHGKVRVCIFTPNELCVACCLCVFSALFWICVAFIICFSAHQLFQLLDSNALLR
jgi:hypothetical protein